MKIVAGADRGSSAIAAKTCQAGIKDIENDNIGIETLVACETIGW